MDPSLAATTSTVTGPVHFLNIEYIFYLIYTAGFSGGGGGGASPFSVEGLLHIATIAWIIITIVAYLLSAFAIGVLVYSTIRMKQIYAAEAPKFATFPDEASAENETEHHRWKHVRELIESGNPNDWRQAIIEADIILDDMLTRLGYQGESVGDKLKSANPAHFRTLNEAWTAHRTRNDIAHQGSTYPLTDQVAYRTILHYENVFREHGEI